jgi:hypothetical protein
LVHSIELAKGKESVPLEVSLGLPLQVRRWFALVRNEAHWLAPRHGRTSFALSGTAILCSFLTRDGLHLVLLAVSGVENILTLFKSSEAGFVVVASRNDCSESSFMRVIAAAGHTFEATIAACMKQAREMASKLHMAGDGLKKEAEQHQDSCL